LESVGDNTDLGFGLVDELSKKYIEQVMQCQAGVQQHHYKKDCGVSLNQTPCKAAKPKEIQASKLHKTDSR
jgi:hypothetical protein